MANRQKLSIGEIANMQLSTSEEDETTNDEGIVEQEITEQETQEELFVEKVVIESDVNLGATVTYTDKDKVYPAVVFVPGAGVKDRDGNTDGSEFNFYKDLSDVFIKYGCVTIRYDKRGANESGGNFSTSGVNDFINDAIAVVKYAKSLEYVDEMKVILCGEIEGAMVSTIVTKSEDIGGLILIGGAGISWLDVQLLQNRLLSEEVKGMKGIRGLLLRPQASLKRNDKGVKKLVNKCVSSEKDSIPYGGSNINAKWIREHATYTSEDYVEMLKQYGKPTLAITGTADISMDHTFHENLQDIANVEIFSPIGVNHLLRKIDDDNSLMTVKQQYIRLSQEPIHLGTLNRLKDWIESNYFSDDHLEGKMGDESI